jgi:hypothetical protein
LFAALIVKRATTLVKQKLGASEAKSIPVQGSTPESATTMQRFGEASASCTLTFTLSGVDIMLTLHGASEQGLFPRIRHALTWLKGLDTCLTDASPGTDKPGAPTLQPKPNDQAQ